MAIIPSHDARPLPTMFPTMAARLAPYWLTVYKRTWRGSVFTSFLMPFLYLAAMGVGLGTFVDDNSASNALGGVSYLVFIAPGLLAITAMQTAIGETTYPVMGGFKWHRVYFSMAATPLTVADIVAAQLAFVLVRIFISCGFFVLILALYSAVGTWWQALVVLAVIVLVGAAHATPMIAISSRMKNESGFALVFRLGVAPMSLFSGAFFPISQLPDVISWLAYLTPIWQRRARDCSRGVSGYPDRSRVVPRREELRPEVVAMTTTTSRTLGPRVVPLFGSHQWRIVERNYLVYRHAWFIFLTGMLEPVFYLFSIGVGVGGLVGDFRLADGSLVGYTAFVAPAMLASSAMNGALFDATYNIFFKLKYDKLYDAMLVTPLRPIDIARGEVIWAVLRGSFYSAAFIVIMVAMGLVESWWMLLALPATMLIGFAFAGAGLALTTWMRSWQDFEYIQLAIIPMFLFSATFYPLSTYPDPIEAVVRWTPLYQGVVLCREMSLGAMSTDSLVAVVYLVAMGTVGLSIGGRRIATLLLK
jgi:lipooligosaccharide transport system permease protein